MYASLRKVKRILDKAFRPLMLSLHRLGFTPLHLTLLSLLFGLCGAFLLFVDWTLAFLLLLLWFLFDVGDGMLARAAKEESKFGAWTDFLVDRVVLVAVLYRYYLFNPGSRLTVLLGLSIVLVFTVAELFRK